MASSCNKPTRMPAAFFGHGSPINTLEKNQYTVAWERFGKRIPRPRGIVCVSAHWYTASSAVTSMRQPRTIHDFRGFPQLLHEFRYPAPGDPALAYRIGELLDPIDVEQDDDHWGLDHGTWSVLTHVYPHADVPVVQLSINALKSAQYHYDLAKKLSPLRDEGILLIGSGNVVHNLALISQAADAAFEWAVRFNELVRSRLITGDHAALININGFGNDGARSIPTPEHYLPLIYVIALQRPDDKLSFLTDGIELGSISMMSIALDTEPLA